MKNRFFKRAFAIALLLVLTIAAIPLGVTSVDVHADKGDKSKTKMSVGDGRFSINISYGIDGMVKLNCNMPVKFEVTNNGDDFQGAVFLVAKSYENDSKTKFAREVSIASGETRSVSMMMPDNADSLSVELRDTKDRLMYQKKFASDLLEKTNFAGTLFGILSDNYADLNYLDGAIFHIDEQNLEYDVKIGELDESSFPNMAKALYSCNAIIIDNYDTSKLSDEQKQALIGYVNAGGLLIVSTGAEYNKVLSGIPTELISGSTGNVSSKNVTFNYYESTGLYNRVGYDDVTSSVPIDQTIEYEDVNDKPVYTDNKITTKLDVADISVDDSENVDFISDEKGLVEVKYVGQGAVVVTDFSIGKGGFAENEEARASVLDNLINYVATDVVKSSISNGSISTDTTSVVPTESAITMNNQSKRPKVFIYAIVLLIYILLAGPVGYLILKKLDKRKMMWVMIPVTSVVFVGIMYLVSIGQVVRKPTVDYIAVDEIKDGVVNETVYASISTSKKGKVNINFSPDYSNVQRCESSPYYGYTAVVPSLIGEITGRNALTDVVFWEKTDHSMVTKESKQAFEKADVKGETTFKADGDLQTEFSLDKGKFTGTITNNTGHDLRHVIVSNGMGCYYFEHISKGDTADLSNAIVSQDTWSLASTITGGYYGGYSIFGFNNNASKKYTEITNITDMVGDQMYSITSGGSGVIYAIVDGAERKITTDEKVDEYGTVLLAKEFSLTYKGVSDLVDSNLNNSCMDTCDGDFDSSNGMLYGSTVEVTYQIDTSEINTLINVGYMITDNNTSRAKCEIYNDKKDSWEPLFDDEDDMEFSLKDDYLYRDNSNMRNLIKIRYSPDSVTGYDNSCAPIIGGGYKHANN